MRHYKIYSKVKLWSTADRLILRALVDYYGNAMRCDWDYTFRRSVRTFETLWGLLVNLPEDSRNPHHLAMALRAARYRASSTTRLLVEMISQEITDVIPPNIRPPPNCICPGGTRDLHVRHLGDIQDNHWKLYVKLRGLCDSNPFALYQFKLYYGPVVAGGLAEDEEASWAFDSAWRQLMSGAESNRNPRHLVAALSEIRRAVKGHFVETAEQLIEYLTAAIPSDVEVPSSI